MCIRDRGQTFDRAMLNALLDLAQDGCATLAAAQQAALALDAGERLEVSPGEQPGQSADSAQPSQTSAAGADA